MRKFPKHSKIPSERRKRFQIEAFEREMVARNKELRKKLLEIQQLQKDLALPIPAVLQEVQSPPNRYLN